MDFTERITDASLREKVRATLKHKGPQAIMVVVLDQDAGVPGESAGLIVSCNEDAKKFRMNDVFIDSFIQFLTEAHDYAGSRN